MDLSTAASPRGMRRSFLLQCISMASAAVMLQTGCGGAAEEGSPDGAGAARKIEASSGADGRQVDGRPLRLTDGL
jgi:hypothetical protein